MDMNSTVANATVAAVAAQEIGMAEQVMGGGIALMLCALLLLTGLKISLDDMRAVRTSGIGPIACILVFDYLIGPVIGAAISAGLRLKADWAMGIMLACVTPPTVAASVVAFLAGADVALVLSASIVSLGCSLVGMPAMFAAGMALYNALGGAGDGQEVEIQLPIAQIVGTMLALLGCAGFGIWANIKWEEETKERFKRWLLRAVKVAFPTVMVSFLASPGLLGATFYFGENALSMWSACFLAHFISMALAVLLALCFKFNENDPKTRDAVIIGIVRRNPAVTMGVAALSFSMAENVDFDAAFGIVMLAGFFLEPITIPMVLCMRKLRFGRYGPQKDGEKEGGERGEGGEEGKELDGKPPLAP